MSAQVATTAPNIPPVQMSLLTRALTDKCFELRRQTTRQAIQIISMLPCQN